MSMSPSPPPDPGRNRRFQSTLDASRRLQARVQASLPAALVQRFIEADLMTQAASLAFPKRTRSPGLIRLPGFMKADQTSGASRWCSVASTSTVRVSPSAPIR